MIAKRKIHSRMATNPIVWPAGLLFTITHNR